MKYKPDKETLMDYLYGELTGESKEKVEAYLKQHPEATKELDQLRDVSDMLNLVQDKEVIAPPIFIDHRVGKFNWNSTYVKVIFSIAASLLLLLVVGKVTDARLNMDNQSFTLSFGEPKAVPAISTPERYDADKLTAAEIQEMINQSISQSNEMMIKNWNENQQVMYTDLKNSLKSNTKQVGQVLENNSLASDEQIREYLVRLQAQNMEMVKDYFKLSANEQKDYMEELLVDFAKYLQQQRTDDLRLLQTRINDIKQNNDMFKQETEQILSSIISNPGVRTVKN